MGDESNFRKVVERVVNQALEQHMAALQGEIVERACAQLEPLLQSAGQTGAAATAPGGAPTDLFRAAFTSILDSTTQADVLSALLAGAARFSARSALFVIRGGTAVGWRAVGFADDHAVKSENLGISSGLMARVVQDRVPAAAAAAEFDAGFIRRFGAPAEGTNALVLPLLLRDKVAALVYADAGDSGLLDTSALDCLVRSTGLWLEVIGIRKSHPTDAPGTITAKLPVDGPEAPPATAEETPAVKTAEETSAAVATAEESSTAEETSAAPVAVETSDVPAEETHDIPADEETPAPAPAVVTVPAPAATAAAAAAVAPALEPPAAPAALSPEEEEVHKKAKRFAKLLVEEIKLYNQPKVSQGRAQKNLYHALRDDIDKSRASYDHRYGHTCAASVDYFTQELIRILCEGDESLLGEGFSR